jgi:hypothetical protein
MKLLPRVFSVLLLAMLFFTGCKKTDDEVWIVKEVATHYMDLLFQGKTRAAYEMLDVESKSLIVYPDYARTVGLYPSHIQEVQDYWAAYYPQTQIEVVSAVVDNKSKTAVVSLTLTQPDPKWFPDEAVAEAQAQGLEGPELGLFVLRKQTEALKDGMIPLVKIAENIKLLKEDDQWMVVYRREPGG